MRDILKRFFPVVSVLAFVLCLISSPLTVSAASEREVLNYKNYVYGSNIDTSGATWEYFTFPQQFCGVMTSTFEGVKTYAPGVMRGTMHQDFSYGENFAMSAYWPGCYIGGKYLDARNLGNGTTVRVEAKFTFSNFDQQTWLKITTDLNVQYFDENFNFIGHQSSPSTVFEIDGSEVDAGFYKSVSLLKPDGAVYMGFYATYSFVVMNTNDEGVSVDFEIGNAYLEAQTSFDSWNDAFIPEFGGFPDDIVLWLRDVADAFLELEIAPDLSFNKILNLVLVVGVLFWFIKVIS